MNIHDEESSYDSGKSKTVLDTISDEDMLMFESTRNASFLAEPIAPRIDYILYLKDHQKFIHDLFTTLLNHTKRTPHDKQEDKFAQIQ